MNKNQKDKIMKQKRMKQKQRDKKKNLASRIIGLSHILFLYLNIFCLNNVLDKNITKESTRKLGLRIQKEIDKK